MNPYNEDRLERIEISRATLKVMLDERTQAGLKAGREEAYRRTLNEIEANGTCCRYVMSLEAWLEARVT